MLDDPGAVEAAVEWLRHAESHLIRARQPRPEGVLLAHVCFDAQQAAEKAVKAVLTLRQIEYPRTHDITDLLDLLDEHDVPFPGKFREAAELLMPYAVGARYPGFERAITEDDWGRAVQMAEAVVRWAREIVDAV